MGRRGHGEGTIRQKGARWEARITEGYDESGKQVRRSFYAPTRAEAQAKLMQAQRRQEEGRPQPDERRTVSGFLEEWLRDVMKPKVRYSTHKRWAGIVEHHIDPKLGRIRLTKLTVTDVQRLLNELLAEGVLSARTIQHVHGCLRAALNHAVRLELVPRNVAALAVRPRSKPHEIRPFDTDEARAFIAAVEGHRLAALFILAIGTGLRRGEILGLRWRDLDLVVGLLTVRYALLRGPNGLELTEPKTKTSRRTITLPGIALTALKAHRLQQLEERVAAGPLWHEQDLVFCTQAGRPLDPDNMTKSFKRVLTKAKLRNQRFHDLRHCCASLLLSQGVHPRVAMEVLGHANVNITLGLYSHVYQELKSEAAVKLDDVLAAKE